MEHIQVNLTDEQRANFKKLADYLSTGKTAMDFDMEYYCADEKNNFNESCGFDPKNWQYGTVGCALGHGPAAGILPTEVDKSWINYLHNCFSNSWMVFDWCFSYAWKSVDNTPEGAAKRINYMLEHGVPQDYDQQI